MKLPNSFLIDDVIIVAKNLLFELFHTFLLKLKVPVKSLKLIELTFHKKSVEIDFKIFNSFFKKYFTTLGLL